jgi:hypothetical protein
MREVHAGLRRNTEVSAHLSEGECYRSLLSFTRRNAKGSCSAHFRRRNSLGSCSSLRGECFRFMLSSPLGGGMIKVSLGGGSRTLTVLS